MIALKMSENELHVQRKSLERALLVLEEVMCKTTYKKYKIVQLLAQFKEMRDESWLSQSTL